MEENRQEKLLLKLNSSQMNGPNRIIHSKMKSISATPNIKDWEEAKDTGQAIKRAIMVGEMIAIMDGDMIIVLTVIIYRIPHQ